MYNDEYEPEIDEIEVKAVMRQMHVYGRVYDALDSALDELNSHSALCTLLPHHIAKHFVAARTELQQALAAFDKPITTIEQKENINDKAIRQ